MPLYHRYRYRSEVVNLNGKGVYATIPQIPFPCQHKRSQGGINVKAFSVRRPPPSSAGGRRCDPSHTPIMAHRARICGILDTIVPAMTPYYAFPLSNALNYITWRLMMIKRFVIRKTPLAQYVGAILAVASDYPRCCGHHREHGDGGNVLETALEHRSRIRADMRTYATASPSFADC